MPRGIVLYARISAENKAALEDLSKEYGIPVSMVADIVLARGLGHPTQDSGSALRKHLDGTYGDISSV